MKNRCRTHKGKGKKMRGEKRVRSPRKRFTENRDNKEKTANKPKERKKKNQVENEEGIGLKER